VRIAIGQINPLITGFSLNAEKIMTYIAKAVDRHADIIVFPEMCVCGYPPMDLLDLDNFVEECLKAVRFIQHKTPKGIARIYRSKPYPQR